MHETLQTLTDVPTFTWSVILLMTASICWFLKSAIGSGRLAILFSPLLVFGALLSTYVFNWASIVFNADKDTNSVIAAAIGIFVALVLAIGFYWVWSLISEARVRAKKVPHAISDPSAR